MHIHTISSQLIGTTPSCEMMFSPKKHISRIVTLRIYHVYRIALKSIYHTYSHNGYISHILRIPTKAYIPYITHRHKKYISRISRIATKAYITYTTYRHTENISCKSYCLKKHLSQISHIATKSVYQVYHASLQKHTSRISRKKKYFKIFEFKYHFGTYLYFIIVIFFTIKQLR